VDRGFNVLSVYSSGRGSPHVAFDFGRTLAELFVSTDKIGHLAGSSVVVTRWINGDSDRWRPVVPQLVRTENPACRRFDSVPGHQTFQMRTITLKLPDGLAARVSAAVRRRGVSTSALA